MPDIFYLVGKWWKQMLLVVMLALAIVAVAIFSARARYMSVATALPANSALTDKASIFNPNIQALYSSTGTPDELDVIIGTAQLDTVYLAVADEYNLWDHYKNKGRKEDFRINAATVLKKNTRVIKSDFGELKVKVWDTDKNLAPQLANAIMDKLNSIHQVVKNESNGAVLHNLKAGREKIMAALDSLSTNGDNASSYAKPYSLLQNSLLEQLQQYEKLVGEYQLVFDSKPSVLIIVERARPSEYADRPDRIIVLTATAFISLLFGLFLALVLERRKIKS